jgi:hypothetical protein
MFDLIEHYNTGPNSELVYQLPLTTWIPYRYKIAYQVRLKDSEVGDLLVCHGNAEVTSEHPFNVMVCSYIVLTKEAYEVVGKIISPAYGGNMDRNEHHRPIFCGGTIEIDDPEYCWVSLILYSASTAAQNGDSVRLESDYGRFYILQYRKR